MPTISIIIPVYNVEKYLRRCLDSIVAQTFTDWQAVCVNDGSPDNCAEILEEYATKDKRFKIVTQENGGLSAARNTGFRHADGEYIMYTDSDDFIHPQTMEIALGLSRRDKSDIVSWYKNGLYRPQLLILDKLGFKIDNIKPIGIKKKYNINRIKSCVTQDVFAHVTEGFNTSMPCPLKRNYVWRHLFRRDIIDGIDFLPRVIFEDFPWWNEVILRRPRVTITRLPFYYYFPDMNSIDRSSAQIKKIKGWMTGLEHIYKIYESRATEYEKTIWKRNVMWDTIIFQIGRKLKYVESPEDRKFVKETLLRFNEMGMFENPPFCRARLYRRKILEYIK